MNQNNIMLTNSCQLLIFQLLFSVACEYRCLLLITFTLFLKRSKNMSLTKSWSTNSSLLSATNNTREVEVVVGYGGLCACRLRHGGCFGCGPRSWSGYPRFVLGWGGSSRLPGLSLRLCRGGRSLGAKRRPGGTCKKHGVMIVRWDKFVIYIKFIIEVCLF